MTSLRRYLAQYRHPIRGQCVHTDRIEREGFDPRPTKTLKIQITQEVIT